MRARILVAVAVGGVVGSLARLAISVALVGVDPYIVPSGRNYPWPTLIVNVVGCLAIGLLNPLILNRPMPAERAAMLQAFMVTGLLGGFTTFSAFASDSALLARDENLLVALLYVVPTLAAGLLAVALGARLAQRWTVADRFQQGDPS